jgi:anti-sigma factor RsiW
MTKWYWRHPSERLLLLLRDGEIPDRHRFRIQAHLKHCPECQSRAAQIDQDWKYLAELNAAATADPAFSEEEQIKTIRASIHAWSSINFPDFSAQTKPQFAQTETGMQIEAVLGVYIGQRAAAALLRMGEASQDSKPESIANAESILGTLLGRKGATAVKAKLLRIMDQKSGSAARFPIL